MNQSLRLRRIYSTVVGPPPPAASETSAVHDPTGRITGQMASIAVTPRLLGTWNASDGLWAVFDDDARKQEVELTQWSQDSLPHRKPNGASIDKASADTWTDVLDVLIQIVAILAVSVMTAKRICTASELTWAALPSCRDCTPVRSRSSLAGQSTLSSPDERAAKTSKSGCPIWPTSSTLQANRSTDAFRYRAAASTGSSSRCAPPPTQTATTTSEAI